MSLSRRPDVRARELRVLDALSDEYHDFFEWMAYPFEALTSRTGYDRALVRRTCRHLARKGLARYERGLFTEDGELAGAGYRITRAGQDAREAERRNEDDDAEPTRR